MTIIEFLEARLAEDEAAAKAAHVVHEPVTGVWRYRENEVTAEGPDVRSLVVKWTWPNEGLHIARHNPDRVLREVAAKRALIESARFYPDAEFPDFAGGFSTAAESALDELAKVWSDHPDYREDWDE